MTDGKGSNEDFHDLEAAVMADALEVFSEKAIDYAMNPRNAGIIPKADAYAGVTGPCGDTMQIWLEIREDEISNAAFWTDGCGPSIACASMVTELAKGKKMQEALDISSEQIVEELGGLPDSHLHCSVLAARTLREALLNYVESPMLQEERAEVKGKNI